VSRYMIISRLRWPALLLLTGIIALLDQAHILSWGHAWPLYLILLGVLALAERATLAAEPPPVGYPYGVGYQGAGYVSPTGGFAGTAPGASPSGFATSSTGIVPQHTNVEPSIGETDEPEKQSRKSWEEEGR
jgi:hypothetical protein